MVEAQNKLIDRFYQEFWIFLILLILVVLMCILLITILIVRFNRITKNIKVLIPVVSIFLIIMSYFVGSLFTQYYKDYLFLKENSPISVKGKVIGYAVAVSGDDLTVTKSWPIIEIYGTSEKITLGVIRGEERLNIDQEYEFVYLPNSKIAEIVSCGR